MKDANITAAQVRKLKADPRVADVEDEGMDEGRFFVHLKPGFDFCYDPAQVTRSKSCGSYAEARDWLKRVEAI